MTMSAHMWRSNNIEHEEAEKVARPNVAFTSTLLIRTVSSGHGPSDLRNTR